MMESKEMIAAGSMLRSSAQNIGRYLIALLNNGRYRDNSIITEQSIKEMWTPYVQYPGLSYDQGGNGEDISYGLGWMLTEVDGRKLIIHGGSRQTMSSMTIIDPKNKLGASILMNIDENFMELNLINIHH